MAALVLLTGLVASLPGEARAQAGDSDTEQAASATQTPPGSAAPASDEPRTVGEFMLLGKNGERIKGRNGSLTANRFTGISEDGQKPIRRRRRPPCRSRASGSRRRTTGTSRWPSTRP